MGTSSSFSERLLLVETTAAPCEDDANCHVYSCGPCAIRNGVLVDTWLYASGRSPVYQSAPDGFERHVALCEYSYRIVSCVFVDDAMFCTSNPTVVSGANVLPDPESYMRLDVAFPGVINAGDVVAVDVWVRWNPAGFARAVSAYENREVTSAAITMNACTLLRVVLRIEG